MALLAPYITIQEADVYLESVGSTIWDPLDDEVKNNALFWGRLYIDSKYSCPDHDPDAPTDEIKLANALLAEDYVQGNLLPATGKTEPRTSRKRAKAGSVESEVYYSGGSRSDYQQDVDALLSGQCRRFGSTVSLVTRN